MEIDQDEFQNAGIQPSLDPNLGRKLLGQHNVLIADQIT